MELIFHYDKPPAGETAFGLAPERYRREYWRCLTCGHFVAANAFDLEELYAGAYMEATYTGDVTATFERIMALPRERSDNAGRARRIVAHWGAHRPACERTLLDVGSGLGVFPARMKEEGWQCTALDPDPGATRHARERIGIAAVEGDFMTQGELGRFGLVTFNKVLEHVEDPIDMLARSRDLLLDGGIAYVEVPDGELAALDSDGPEREEFFVEHLHVFSAASVALLATRAGFTTRSLERLREPSDKYTLFGFLEA